MNGTTFSSPFVTSACLFGQWTTTSCLPLTEATPSITYRSAVVVMSEPSITVWPFEASSRPISLQADLNSPNSFSVAPALIEPRIRVFITFFLSCFFNTTAPRQRTSRLIHRVTRCVEWWNFAFHRGRICILEPLKQAQRRSRLLQNVEAGPRVSHTPDAPPW